MNVLTYILDTVRTNMYTIWNELHEEKFGSFDFLWSLGEDLIKPHMLTRYRTTIGLQRHITTAMQQFLGVKENPPRIEAVEKPDRTRCYICVQELRRQPSYKKKKNRLTRCKWCCVICEKGLCKNHMRNVCGNCIEQ